MYEHYVPDSRVKEVWVVKLGEREMIKLMCKRCKKAWYYTGKARLVGPDQCHACRDEQNDKCRAKRTNENRGCDHEPGPWCENAVRVIENGE